MNSLDYLGVITSPFLFLVPLGIAAMLFVAYFMDNYEFKILVRIKKKGVAGN